MAKCGSYHYFEVLTPRLSNFLSGHRSLFGFGWVTVMRHIAWKRTMQFNTCTNMGFWCVYALTWCITVLLQDGYPAQMGVQRERLRPRCVEDRVWRIPAKTAGNGNCPESVLVPWCVLSVYDHDRMLVATSGKQLWQYCLTSFSLVSCTKQTTLSFISCFFRS